MIRSFGLLTWAALCWILLPGCEASRDGSASAGVFSAGESAGTSGPTGMDGTEDDGTDGGATSESDGGIVKLDVGAGDVTASDEGGSDKGCEKIDFLFVVDNSSSMENEQESLIASFPAFIQGIEAQVEGADFHVMVVDSDGDPAYACEPTLHENDPAWVAGCPPNYMPYCTAPCPSSDYFCEGYSCGSNEDELSIEDKTLGCGVRKPYGGSASNVDCGIAEGRRYMTQDQPDLAGTFACAAKVGVSGHWWEQPVTAMLAALGPELQGSGGCNEGFLRDDAVLVVVLISDDLSRGSDGDDVLPGTNGSPQEWYQQLVSLKAGDPTAIAILGIIADPAYPHATVCDPARVFGDGAKFAEFVDLFGPQGRIADVCEPAYAALFAETVELVAKTCDEFEPPG